MENNEIILLLTRFCKICNQQGCLDDYFLEPWEGVFQVIINETNYIWIRVENNHVEFGFGTVPKWSAKFEMPADTAEMLFRGNTFGTSDLIRKSIKQTGSNNHIMKFFQLSDLVWFNKDKHI
jgi:hypothetical protein